MMNPPSETKRCELTDIVVSTLGESVNEATVAKWMKKAGDSVPKDETLVELEHGRGEGATRPIDAIVGAMMPIAQSDPSAKSVALQANTGALRIRAPKFPFWALRGAPAANIFGMFPVLDGAVAQSPSNGPFRPPNTPRASIHADVGPTPYLNKIAKAYNSEG